MSTIKVFHGSDHIIREPIYLGGKEDNDYGNGFYTTEYPERAENWAALNGSPERAVVNEYEIVLTGLQILDLNEKGVLAWIAEVVSNRGANMEAAAIVGERLVEKYKIDTSRYDIIKGYRADDSYTQVIEAFLTNQVNVNEVERLFYKGSLGNQIFLKSRRAFSQIEWTGAYEVREWEKHQREDSRARREVNKFMQSRMKAILLEGYVVPGIIAQYALQNSLQYHREGDYYEPRSL